MWWASLQTVTFSKTAVAPNTQCGWCPCACPCSLSGDVLNSPRRGWTRLLTTSVMHIMGSLWRDMLCRADFKCIAIISIFFWACSFVLWWHHHRVRISFPSIHKVFLKAEVAWNPISKMDFRIRRDDRTTIPLGLPRLACYAHNAACPQSSASGRCKYSSVTPLLHSLGTLKRVQGKVFTINYIWKRIDKSYQPKTCPLL